MVATTTKQQQDNVKDTSRPDYRCKAAVMMSDEELELCRDFAIGPKAIKAKAKYLPQEEGEHADSYAIRLDRSLVFNTFQKTLNALVGMPFNVDPILDKDVPAQLKADLEDVDLAGTHFDVFLREQFYRAVRDGHSFIFIDAPPPLETSITSAAPVPDASDDLAAGRRAFWIGYEKDQAYNWASDRINGETVLTRITFRECVTVPDGEYGEKDVIRYRVLKLQVISPAQPLLAKAAVYGPMQWKLFQEIKHGNNKSTFQEIGGGVTKLQRIPVVAVYTNRTGFLISAPPLAGLAKLNLGHYQQWSDLADQIRYLAPLTVRKLDVKEEIEKPDADPKQYERLTIGRKSVVTIAGEHAKVELVSHNPDCIKPAHDFIKDLEQAMSVEGVSLIAAKDEKEVTLGEKQMDQAERLSALGLWVRNLTDAAEQCLRFHARYYNLNDGGSIIITLSGVNEDAVKAVAAPLPTPTGAVQDRNAAPVA